MAVVTCWIGSVSGTSFSPSSTAARATASATDADTTRTLSTGGSSGAPGAVASDSEATGTAAAAIMATLIRCARATVTPSPSPGNTSALLAWAMRYVRPPWTTGGNGLPVATRARPSVQRIRSAGSASAFEVGLDSGMMIGRSTWAAIDFTMASLNAPAWVEVSISMVGWTCSTTSASPTPRSSPRTQPANSATLRAYGTWKSYI